MKILQEDLVDRSHYLYGIPAMDSNSQANYSANARCVLTKGKAVTK
jgi:hypothetical protein